MLDIKVYWILRDKCCILGEECWILGEECWILEVFYIK